MDALLNYNDHAGICIHITICYNKVKKNDSNVRMKSKMRHVKCGTQKWHIICKYKLQIFFLLYEIFPLIKKK